MKYQVKNEPHAHRLIAALRHVGYDNVAAVADLVDNPFDAEATRIDITLLPLKENVGSIVITDNGCGMHIATLDEALRLGSDTDRVSGDLGRFGMGLCTASLSLGRRVEVTTREKNGELLESVQDVDEIEAAKDFVKYLGPARSDIYQPVNFPSNFASGSFTQVRLMKLDGLTNKDWDSFSGTLKKELGRIFRLFIEAGKVISVNGEPIKIEDPLWSKTKGTMEWMDEEYEVPGGKVRIRINLLPDMSLDVMVKEKVNTRTQGFSIIRNNREIDWGVSLELWRRHGEMNRMRGEIRFDDSLDDGMGINFSKRGINPTKAVYDVLARIIEPQIKSIRKTTRKVTEANPDPAVDHKDAQDIINAKAKLLLTPPAEIEKRKPKTNKGKRTPVIEDPDKEPKTHVPRTRHTVKALACEFVEAHYGESGPLYECDQRGKTTIVEYNADHPFYRRMILENKDSKEVLAVIDYLFYAMATAELIVDKDGANEVMTSLKTLMSANLRTLLS